jgi:hypothetical protein
MADDQKNPHHPAPISDNLPDHLQNTGRELQEAQTVLKASFLNAVRGNLVLAACVSIYVGRAGRHFWATKGRKWFKRARIFADDAYKAMLNDAFDAGVKERNPSSFTLPLTSGYRDAARLEANATDKNPGTRLNDSRTNTTGAKPKNTERT